MVQRFKCLLGLLFCNKKLSNNFLSSRSKNQTILGFSVFSFYWLHVRWKITLPERFFYFWKVLAKVICSFSFCCSPSMFLFYCSHVLKKYLLYIHFYISVSVCMPVHVFQRFPTKLKFFLLLLCFNIQHTIAASAFL